MTDPAEIEEDGPPGWARPFVAVFLAAFLAAGLFGIEAWPLTGWRLFSHVRSPDAVSWQAVAVTDGGLEHPIRFAGLAPRYRNFALVMRDFVSLSTEQRRGACTRWRETAGARAVRIYRLETPLWPRKDGRAARPPTRALAFACGGRDAPP
jgi:hypothetical protein